MPRYNLPSNRKLGVFFTAVFVVIGAYFYSDEAATISYVLFVLAVIFFIITLINFY